MVLAVIMTTQRWLDVDDDDDDDAENDNDTDDVGNDNSDYQ